MRDPKRIKPILEALETIWTAYPDMRLGQLIYCASTGSEDHLNRLFNMEDEALVKGLWELIRRGGK